MNAQAVLSIELVLICKPGLVYVKYSEHNILSYEQNF